MHRIPLRISLIVQTQEVILQGVRSGRWQGRLPGERRLCEELHVSRWTLRHALTMLARQKIIRISHGQSCAIIGRSRTTPLRQQTAGNWHVGLITPEPLWRLRHFVALWVDALRVRLQAQGGDLHLYDGSSFYGRGCAAALERLTQHAPHNCWSLLLSTHAMQKWFRDQGLPVVVIGSSFNDVQMPSVDVAYRAVGRHAAGLLLAQGHRRIAWLSAYATLAGVMECQRGFSEAFAATRYEDAELIICQHTGMPEDICRTLDRLWRRPKPPTALYLQQSSSLLTTLTHLAQVGLQTPRDLSIIVAEDEPYFSHLVPEIARYASDPNGFARRIVRFLKQAAEGTLQPDAQAHIMPTFMHGGTITSLRGARESGSR